MMTVTANHSAEHSVVQKDCDSQLLLLIVQYKKPHKSFTASSVVCGLPTVPKVKKYTTKILVSLLPVRGYQN